MVHLPREGLALPLLRNACVRSSSTGCNLGFLWLDGVHTVSLNDKHRSFCTWSFPYPVQGPDGVTPHLSRGQLFCFISHRVSVSRHFALHFILRANSVHGSMFHSM